jgi:hypothetical protein
VAVKKFYGPKIELTDTNFEDVELYSNYGTFASSDLDIFVHYYKNKQEKNKIEYYKLTQGEEEFQFLESVILNTSALVYEGKLSTHSPDFKYKILPNKDKKYEVHRT